MSEDGDLWPVEPSQAVAEALADPKLPVDQFSKIVALTVAIAQDPWFAGSRTASQGEPWRTVPIPDGGGIVEYAINETDHKVILTRIFPF
ncbi:MAG: hypothetical protein ACRDTD_16420 [Pseudonocardiaceae bacterium]